MSHTLTADPNAALTTSLTAPDDDDSGLHRAQEVSATTKKLLDNDAHLNKRIDDVEASVGAIDLTVYARKDAANTFAEDQTLNKKLHVKQGADFDTTLNADGAATFGSTVHAAGTIDSDGNVVADGTVHGGNVLSDHGVQAAEDFVSTAGGLSVHTNAYAAGNVTAGGTVQGALVSSSGNVTAVGNVAGNGLIASGDNIYLNPDYRIVYAGIDAAAKTRWKTLSLANATVISQATGKTAAYTRTDEGIVASEEDVFVRLAVVGIPTGSQIVKVGMYHLGDHGVDRVGLVVKTSNWLDPPGGAPNITNVFNTSQPLNPAPQVLVVTTAVTVDNYMSSYEVVVDLQQDDTLYETRLAFVSSGIRED